MIVELIVQLLNSVSFPLKLIIGIAFFARLLKRRKLFALRASLSAAVVLGFSLAVYKPLFDINISYLLNVLQFVLAAFAVWLCFDVSYVQIAFVMGLVLAIQQLAFNFITILYLCIFINNLNDVDPIVNIIVHFIQIGFVALVYMMFVCVIFRRYRISDDIIIKNKTVILIDFLLIIILFVVFHFIFVIGSVNDPSLFIYIYIITGISCVFAVGYCMSIFKKERLDDEMETIRKVIDESNRQYKILKENIDIINRKCHDMKFILSSLGDGKQSAYLDEFKHAVDIYGSTPKTGSTVLDVVLSESFLRAKEAGVDLSCIADGELLGFMDDADLYALFGNAVSNAIEASARADENGRYISVYVGMSDVGLIRISVENGYKGSLRFRNGLPLSTKGDPDNHGFGMKSIEYIVRKYGGGLDISSDNSVFKLAIVLRPSSTGNAD